MRLVGMLKKLTHLKISLDKGNTMTNTKLNSLEAAWRYQNTVVEALEAENAPDKYITIAKKKRLQIKDKIAILKNEVLNND